MYLYDNEICISAFSGDFPTAPNADSLWRLLLNNQKAVFTKMTDYWCIPEDKIYDTTLGKKNFVYLNTAYCLESAQPDNHAGRQVETGKSTIDKLLNALKTKNTALDFKKTGLILASSWCDESFYLEELNKQPINSYTPESQLNSLKRHAGIEGPVFGVDTACSSVLYAMNMAKALIATKQVDSIIVLSLNTLLLPTLYLGFSQIKALSSQGSIQAFGLGADGIIPAESSAAFLVEKKETALKNNRHPIAIIKGIGLSSDGAEGSVFAPGKQGQLNAYSRAYKNYPVDQIDYIEAHGTATKLGDATEIISLDTFFKDHYGKNKLIIGSIKSNVGHSLAAAGGPSLTKALYIIKNKTIPPQLPYEATPQLDQTCLRLAESQATTLSLTKPMSVAISSFGFGGSNAHLVIEEYKQSEHKVTTNDESTVHANKLVLDLAIVDLKAAYGHVFDLNTLQDNFTNKKEITSTNFPNKRFLNRELADEIPKGKYLSKDHKIDITNYKMGPKPLSAIDPYKLLISDQVNQIINHTENSYNRDKVAVIVCCNIGGEYFNNAYKIVYDHYTNEKAPSLDMQVNHVATTLPSMLSGYPAQFFDIKGFHQTLYGSAGLIWNTLLTIPKLLEGDIDTVLLGGGRFISSSAELKKLRETDVIQGEGIGLLALQAKQNTSNIPIATITTAILSTGITGFSQACALADVSESEQILHLCELNPSDSIPMGEAQHITGFLSEASGLETIIAILLGRQKYHAIEVREKGKPLLWLFIERHGVEKSLKGQMAEIKLPFQLNFNKHDEQIPSQVIEELSTISNSMRLLLDESEQILLKNMQIRKKILESIITEIKQQSTFDRLPQKKHQTIEQIYRLDTNSLHCKLLVDQTNTYFFDHPLDHVPGILLLAGVLDALSEQLNTTQFYVAQMSIRFFSYVNLEDDVSIKISKVNENQYTALILQNEKTACKCQLDIQYDQLIRDTELNNLQSESKLPCSRLEILHKKNADNVLITDMHQTNCKLYAHTVDIGATHYFYHNFASSHSALYFLEIARQFFMQIAHQYLNIPLNTPMNLVDITIRLNGFLPQNIPLELGHTITTLEGKKSTKNNFIQIDLNSEQKSLGSISILAQTLDSLS